MPKSEILMSLDALSDLLFPKRDVQITEALVDINDQIRLTIEGNDVPDSASTFLEYNAVYGRALTDIYDGDGSDLVREVRLVSLKGSRS